MLMPMQRRKFLNWSVVEHFYHSGVWDRITIEGPDKQRISLSNIHFTRSAIKLIAAEIAAVLNNYERVHRRS